MNTPDTAFPVDELLAQRPWVRSLARSLVRDEHSAADLEQDTWVRALERPPARRDSLRGWLATVLRNRRLDTAKMEARRTQRELAAPAAGAADGPAEMAARAELHRRVIACVLALDEPYRATVLYRFFEGLSPAEIAARQGVNASTVRTRLARALERLRAALAEAQGDDEADWRAALAPLLGSAAGGNGATTTGRAPGRAAGLAGRRTWLGFAAAAVLVVIAAGLGLRTLRGGGDDGGAPPVETAAADPGPGGDATSPRRDPGRRRARADASRADAVAPADTAPGDDDSAPGEDAPSVAADVDAPTAVVTVLDADGRPVEGAEVRVVNPLPPGKLAYGLVLFTGTTGADGKVTVTSPLSRDLGLIAKKGERVGERRLALAAPEELMTTDVRLGPALRVGGRLLGRDDIPVAGARVSLADAHLAAIRHTTSARDGSFAFDDVPAGLAESEPKLYAVAKGHVEGEASVEIVGGVARPVTFRMQPAIRVRGRCVDEEGRPVAEVFVSAAAGRGTAETGSDGTFALDGLPLDAVELDFESGTHAARRLVHEATETGDLDLGDVVLSRGGTIRGVVVLEDGTPVADATVHLESRELDQFVGQTRTDADGRFVLERVGSGAHVLHASGPGGGARWASGPEGRADDVHAGAVGVRIVATRAHSLHVELLDGKTGKPVAVPSVTVKLSDPAGKLKPAEHGYFSDAIESVRVSVPTLGPFDVTVEAPGYAVKTVEGVRILADRETPLRVTLERAQ